MSSWWRSSQSAAIRLLHSYPYCTSQISSVSSAEIAAMDQNTLFGILAVDRGIIVCSSVLALLVLLLSTLRNGKNQLPLLGEEYRSAEQRRKLYLASAGTLYRKGQELFRDKPYRLETADGEPPLAERNDNIIQG